MVACSSTCPSCHLIQIKKVGNAGTSVVCGRSLFFHIDSIQFNHIDGGLHIFYCSLCLELNVFRVRSELEFDDDIYHAEYLQHGIND